MKNGLRRSFSFFFLLENIIINLTNTLLKPYYYEEEYLANCYTDDDLCAYCYRNYFGNLYFLTKNEE